MYYTEQKELAKQIFEKLGLNVDLTGCFDTIIPQLTIEQCLQVLNLVDDEKVRSEWAYTVGKFKPENRKDVIDFVTDSHCAYFWAKHIGNNDVMINRIKDSEHAYIWSIEFGDRNIMINRVTDSEYAFFWSLKFGDRNIMINRVTDPKYAYRWAIEIGDVDIMLPKFANTEYVFDFIEYKKSRKGIKQHLTNPDIIKKWVEKFGGKKYFTTKFPELSFN